MKLIYRIKTAAGGYENKRISTKVLKMDENNQYGNAMTQPLPYGCIKNKWKKITSLRESNMIHNKVSHTVKMSHLFIVDIKFHVKNEKTLSFNEMYSPIFEKSKLIKPYERSVLQLLSVLLRNEEKDIINVKEKEIIPLYVEHIHFPLIKGGWLVTKNYKHYMFEQACFNKEFVTMNQNTRQNAETPVERNFHKLMKNANFGIDCRNNIDNFKFESIYDGISETSFVKKYVDIFGN